MTNIAQLIFFHPPIAALFDGLQNFHPLFVHFPLALLPVALLFDVLGYVLKKPSLSAAGWWCFALGVVSAIVTVFTGLQAEETVSLSQEAHEVLEHHEQFQIYSTVFLTALLIWRGIKRGGLPNPSALYLLITAIAVGAITFGAHYGGALVYRYGVGTSVQPAATQNQEQPEDGNTEESLLPVQGATLASQ
ncbi:MAG: DUF2231 domain-containing protein [Synechococcales bacterium]|nr:DUF2231 domain-containing protein [Synechococcales bacterium]